MQTPSDRWNIVMIMADQWTADAIGSKGHPTVRTPNLDQLARCGVSFDHCYCNSPMCAPSRASMVTGRYPSRVGVYDNGSEFPASAPTFMHLLKRGGYRTVLSGKMHFIGPDQFHGFQERLTEDIYPASFIWTPDWERGPHLNPGSNVEPIRDSGSCEANLQLDYDEEVHFRALECLRKQARQATQPFFLCVSYTHPHDPFVAKANWWEEYEGADISLPSVPGRPLTEMDAYNQWIQIHHGVEDFPLTEEQIKAARRAYYGMVSYFDEKVGQLLEELDRLKLSERTIVIVTSDHGEMLGEHGMWFKRTFYDPAAKVPMIVSAPFLPAGRSAEQVISLVDLFPTLLDLADIPIDGRLLEQLDGHSFAGLLRGESAGWGNEAILEYCGEGTVRPLRMLRSERYKYVFVEGLAPLLFDLESDPGEQRNLAGDPAFLDVEERLRGRLLQGWDAAGLERRIRTSQRERRMIQESQSTGERPTWDWQPFRNRERTYVRENSQDENAGSRFPRPGIG